MKFSYILRIIQVFDLKQKNSVAPSDSDPSDLDFPHSPDTVTPVVPAQYQTTAQELAHVLLPAPVAPVQEEERRLLLVPAGRRAPVGLLLPTTRLPE